MKKVHFKPIDTIINELETDVNKGLSSAQVNALTEKYGENTLVSRKGRSLSMMIFDQFKDFMIILLIVAAALSIYLGEEIEGFVILGIVILNAALGAYQENRASNALEALKSMAAPKAKLLRDGNITQVSSKAIVPGDIIVLEAGDYVAADVRLIDTVNLKIDESALTGESLAVEKDSQATIEEEAALGDRLNCAYMSTIVTYGRSKGIVVGTGMDTEIGHIASMLNESEESLTPLQMKLAAFGRQLGILCVAVCVVIFALGAFRGEDYFALFMTAVSLAVAAIPEGLPAVVTVVLSMGMQRMVKRNAIVKRLSAVETLGSTNTICTDKTGTLTQNKMTVLHAFDGVDQWDVSGSGYGFEGDLNNIEGKDLKSLERLLQVATLCNDADVQGGEVIGDPTEGALIVLAAKAGFNKGELNNNHPRLNEFPFDSERKLMSTLHKIDDEFFMLTKGAPDLILKHASHIVVKGVQVELTDDMKERISNKNREYAKNAMRVLGYAYKRVSQGANLQEEEVDLVFAGLTAMIDPPREEAKKAVALCKDAGIRVVMITGDHITTASSIANQIGILDENSKAMEGSRIDDYSEESFREVVKTTNVFARVSPEHKVKIVRAIRENGDVVAMTGDGVNDAPALKKADIGIAMGVTGTDVSKEAADMILTDDNFASIVDAVEEGRIIYSNIRKFVGFLLSCNIGEILIIFLAILFRWPVPLLPIQLLWVNLITDSFPAFALGLEEGEPGVMKQKPRDKEEAIIDRPMALALGLQSIGLTIAVLSAYRLGYALLGDGTDGSLLLARTMAFSTLIIGEMLRAYSSRTEVKSIFKIKILANKYLNYSVFTALGLLGLILYVPFLSRIFDVQALSLIQLLIVFGLGLIPSIFSELSKLVKN